MGQDVRNREILRGGEERGVLKEGDIDREEILMCLWK